MLGVDILKSELDKLTATGYDVLVQDALTLRLDRKFDVVVCGDLIEHVNNPLALLQTMEWHLNDGGIGVVSTPNPFSAMRFMTFLVEGQTEVNTEHVMWLCPKTMYQLVDRSNLQISDFFWLKTDYTPGVTRRFFAHTSNFLGSLFAKGRRTMLDDFGVILRKS